MSLPNILLILAAISIGATVITIIIAFRSDREAQSAIFPIVREEEARRAQRSRLYIFVWAAVTALFLGGWLATFQSTIPVLDLAADVEGVGAEAVAFSTETPIPLTDQSPAAAIAENLSIESTLPPSTQAPGAAETVNPPENTEQTVDPTSPPEPTTDPPSATPLPPTATPLLPTLTLEPTATFTPTPTPLSDTFTVPTTGPRTPAPPNARMGPIQFSAEITDDVQAINPSDTFPPNLERIYAVFPYSGMEDGLDFVMIWYKDGVELWRDESQWEWGDQARFFSFFNNPGAGLYKVELQVNDSILATGLVEVR